MTARAIQVKCAQESLPGIMHFPDSLGATPEPRRAVLVLVGGPQYRVGSHRQFLLAARYLSARGHAVLRYDFRGMGDSTGEAPGFEHVRIDVQAGIDAMFKEVTSLQSVSVFGLCDGASAAMLHATDDPRVDSLILANPWVRSAAGQAAAIVKHYYAQRLLQRNFWLKLLRGGLNPFYAIRGLLGSMRASRSTTNVPTSFIDGMLAGLNRFHGRVLLISSGRDLTAREFDDLCVRDARWSAAMAARGVQRVDLPDTDHTFSDRAGLDAANAAICDFLAEPSQGELRTSSQSIT